MRNASKPWPISTAQYPYVSSSLLSRIIAEQSNDAGNGWINHRLVEKEVDVTVYSTSSERSRYSSRDIANMLIKLLLVALCLISTSATIVVPLLLTGNLRASSAKGNWCSCRIPWKISILLRTIASHSIEYRIIRYSQLWLWQNVCIELTWKNCLRQRSSTRF